MDFKLGLTLYISCHLFVAALPEKISAMPQVDTLFALRIDEEIGVDGDLDEEVWDKAPAITKFIQRELYEGLPATEKTRAAILYTTTCLYIGLWAFDSSPQSIIAKESKRDFDWSSDDNFEIILGPFNDNRNGYLFVINPNGAMADVLISDDGEGFNKDWNGVWQAAVERDEEGWFAEIEIPFSTLKFPDKDQRVWALNMERNIRRKNEQVLWQGWSRDYDLEQLSQAGRLAGLTGMEYGSRWEIKPYINFGLQKETQQSTVHKFKAGGDINYPINPMMKLQLTLNTDFAQVESDRDIINLTRYSLLFPEKREFFLDEKDFFDFNLGENTQLFYSRQIGLHDRMAVPLIGGLRLNGKIQGSNLGIMSIQSARKDSLPSINYSVLRFKQDVYKQSNVGLIITAKNDKYHYNYLYGVEANYQTSEFLGDKNFEMGAALSQTFTEKKSNADNLGYRLFINYPNDFAEFELSTTRVQENFNPEIGFLHRGDYQLYFSQLQLNPRPAFLPMIRNLEFVPFEIEYYITDHNRSLETIQMEFRPLGIDLKQGDHFEFNIQRYYEHLDEEFEILDSIYIPTGKYWYTRYETALETFRGRPFFSQIQYSWGKFYAGERKETELALGWNLSHELNLSLDWEHNEVRLVSESFTTDELGGRIEYGFNPNLFTSLFTQWNNNDNEILLNFRLNWIPSPGSYFYFVVNQEWETESNTARLLNTTIIGKLIWRFSVH
jgi:hypothetical protein